MYPEGFKEKAKQLLESIVGRPYKIEERSPGMFLCLPEELKENDPNANVVLIPNGIVEVRSGELCGSMSKKADIYYRVMMNPDDCNLVMRKDNRKARTALRKLAPGIVKDFDTAERFAEEFGLKYANGPNLIEVDYNDTRYTSKFSTVGMSEDEAMKQLEKRIRAVFEASAKFLEWDESEEKKSLYLKTSLKRELPRSRKFCPYWPPNYGDQKRNEEHIKWVTETLEKYHVRVYTPDGELELKNGKLVIKKEGTRKS